MTCRADKINPPPSPFPTSPFLFLSKTRDSKVNTELSSERKLWVHGDFISFDSIRAKSMPFGGKKKKKRRGVFGFPSIGVWTDGVPSKTRTEEGKTQYWDSSKRTER